MKRVNGYIDLNELDTRFFMQSSYEETHYWVNIGDSSYYYKDTCNPYHELVCSELANMLNLNCVQYDLAVFKNTKGVISKSYRQNGATYISGRKILEKYRKTEKEMCNAMGIRTLDYRNIFGGPSVILMNNLEVIWQAISCFYSKTYSQEDIINCMNGLVKEFIFSLIVGNYDKSSHNWELELFPNKLNLVPMFDNESTFSCQERRILMTSTYKESFQYLNEVLEKFLCISENEYVDLFLEMFYSLDKNSIDIAIEKVEAKIHSKIPSYIKDEIIESYIWHRYKIEKVLHKLNLGNNLER